MGKISYFYRIIFDTHFISPFSPLGLVSWNVLLPSCVSLSTELSRRHEIAWRLFGHSCTIAWFDGHTYNRSTTSTWCVDILRSPRRPSRSAPLDAALPPRSWPRTSQTAAGADEPTPAGFASTATSASLLPPAVQRRHDFLLLRALLCRALHNCSYLRYSICPTICLSVSRSKRRTFRTGTVISGIRERF